MDELCAKCSKLRYLSWIKLITSVDISSISPIQVQFVRQLMPIKCVSNIFFHFLTAIFFSTLALMGGHHFLKLKCMKKKIKKIKSKNFQSSWQCSLFLWRKMGCSYTFFSDRYDTDISLLLVYFCLSTERKPQYFFRLSMFTFFYNYDSFL